MRRKGGWMKKGGLRGRGKGLEKIEMSILMRDTNERKLGKKNWSVDF